MVKRFPVPPRCASVTWSRFRASNLRLWKQQRLAVEKPWFYQALRSWNLVLIPGPWSLVPDSGPEKGQVIPVMERLEIGRALDCDISILEPSLSRKHAERHLIGDDLVVRDLGSVNDTWVNAEKIDEEVKLKDSDVLQFERIKLIVSSPT